MEVSTKQFKRCDLVEASGRVDGKNAPKLAEAFEAIINDGRFRIVFDMNKVDFFSSAGLHVIIDAQKTCKRWNRGEVVLASVPPHIYEVLDMVGFVPLFKFYDNAIDAVASF